MRPRKFGAPRGRQGSETAARVVRALRATERAAFLGDAPAPEPTKLRRRRNEAIEPDPVELPAPGMPRNAS